MSLGVFRGKESLNRIQLSRLVQDLLNFGVLGSLQLWGWGVWGGWMGVGGVGGWMGLGVVGGWGWGVGGWGGGGLGVPPTHVHMHVHAHMAHTHYTH